jgi:hypothetical protein
MSSGRAFRISSNVKRYEKLLFAIDENILTYVFNYLTSLRFSIFKEDDIESSNVFLLKVGQIYTRC